MKRVLKTSPSTHLEKEALMLLDQSIKCLMIEFLDILWVVG